MKIGAPVSSLNLTDGFNIYNDTGPDILFIILSLIIRPLVVVFVDPYLIFFALDFLVVFSFMYLLYAI